MMINEQKLIKDLIEIKAFEIIDKLNNQYYRIRHHNVDEFYKDDEE